MFEEAKADKELHRRRAKAIKFLKNEAYIIQNQRKNHLTGTDSQILKDIEISSIGSAKQLPKEYQRTFWEKISEFNDPQRVLGSGISSYHQQLVHLFFLMFVLLLMHIPVMFTYAGYGYFDNPLQMLTLGNMGFSEAHCKIYDSGVFVSDDQPIEIECGSGNIDVLIDFGVTTKYENQHSCSRLTGSQYCNQFFHDLNFKVHFQTECMGRKDCQLKSFMNFMQKPQDTSLFEICENSASKFYL